MVIVIHHVYDDDFDQEKNHDHVACMNNTTVSTYSGDGVPANIYTSKNDKFGFIQFQPKKKRGDEQEIIYYEVTILDCANDHVTLGVGFDRLGIYYGAKQGMVGWWNNSIGYHGDDGNIIHYDVEEFAKNVPSIIAPPFGKNDVVGAYWNQKTGNVFFTLNGRKVDQIVPGCKNNFNREYNQSRDSDGTTYDMFVPTVSIDEGQKCTFSVNTGERPFLIDVQYQQFVEAASKALVAARTFTNAKSNDLSSNNITNDTLAEILDKASQQILSSNEIATIIKIAQNKSNLFELDKESYLEQVRPNARI